jgi:SAM-dependent methyltransferase
VARRIFLNNPDLHIDIGSRIDGFVAHVASFREIEVLDIRGLKSHILNVKFVRADLMGNIDKALVNYTDSLSCLHALEHFGLGRYGDAVRFDGYILGLNNMHTILKRGGKFYLSVPIGPQRIEFNAHRVFALKYMLLLLEPRFKIDSFSFVNDRGDLFENMELTKNEVDRNFGCFYGCGIWEMTKL